jgi:N-acetyl-anhydromuramyl-L-alanine amidase AmpD
MKSVKTTPIDFPEDQYIPVEHPKNQIVLHHTVSPEGVSGDVNWWKSNRQRVATCTIIAHSGEIFRLFSSKHWAHHLGLKREFLGRMNAKKTNMQLNQQSIGVEIDSAGGLDRKNGKWISAWGAEIPEHKVEVYPQGFRGYYGFERYTDAQIKSLEKLLKYWGSFYGISIKYKGSEMWDVSEKALNGVRGVWAHVSYRPDKSDIHPQPNLLEMLRSL